MEVAVEPSNGLSGEASTWRVPIHHDLFVLETDPSPTKVDLCDYIDASTLLRGFTHRFCSKTFSLTDDEGKKLLQTSLAKAARESGGLNLVVASGLGKKQTSGARVCFILACECSLSYTSTSDAKYDKENHAVKDGKYKNRDLHNDGRNKRPGGKNDTHRTTTTKVLNREAEGACRFRLPVYVDSTSYFLRSGTGCSIHSRHVRLSPKMAALLKPTRHWTEEEKKVVSVTKKARAGASVAANTLFAATGTHATRDQSRGIGKVRSGTPVDEVEEIKATLERHGAKGIFLYQTKLAVSESQNSPDVLQSNVLCNEITENGVVTVAPPVFDATQSDQLNAFTNHIRKLRGFQPTQQVMLAFAWILPFELKQFRLFPFVLHVDGTKCTNKEQRVLFTASGRDSTGKQFLVFRALIPNECAWMFQWLFGNVMPNLIGIDVLRRVRIVLTDGDSQETSQLDVAMSRLMPEAFRARCIWHVVDRGMRKKYPNYMSAELKRQKEKKTFKAVKKTIREWLWLWSQDICETEEEFKLSKALFDVYMNSDKVAQAFNPAGGDSPMAAGALEKVRSFVRENVLPHESFFVFYRRQFMLAFETNSNSAHEGTNHGMKSHSQPTNPQHTIVDATDVLCDQAARSERKMTWTVVRKIASKSLHSTLPTANTLTDLGNGLVEKQWQQAKNYNICGPNGHQWLCMRRADNAANGRVPKAVPRFSRVRTVSCCPTSNILTCSCGYFERVGIPCRHLLKILSVAHGAGYKGATADDVRIFWRKDYYFFGIDDTRQAARDELLSRRDSDVKGPLLRVALNSIPFVRNDDIVEEKGKTVWERCVNYHPEMCRLVWESLQPSGVPAGLSQEIVNYGMGSIDYGDGGIDGTFDEMIEDTAATLEPARNAWEEWSPKFKYVVDIANANYSTEVMAEGNAALDDMIARIDKLVIGPAPASKRPRVSVCAAQSNLKTSHGAEKW
jgi:MULE transposase domain/SWIM zinc finger